MSELPVAKAADHGSGLLRAMSQIVKRFFHLFVRSTFSSRLYQPKIEQTKNKNIHEHKPESTPYSPDLSLAPIQQDDRSPDSAVFRLRLAWLWWTGSPPSRPE